MYQAIGIVELKSIAKGIEATDAALKSAGVKLVSAHPSCPGKYEIILTGGIAYSKYCVEEIKKQVGFLAPVVVLPGEGEMESLAFNALGALNGELPIHEYK